MASLTVRQLDERLKTLLRLRAARNGRSMEDEIRSILREAADAAEQTFIHGITPAASERDEIWDQAVRAVATMLRGLANEAQPPSEADAAATFARECTDHAAVILWCADRVRWVDNSEAVQDAADYLHDLSTRAQVDATPVTDRAAVIRWCAQQIHSMGGDADVERAAEYLDDLAVEAQEAADEVQAQANLDALVPLFDGPYAGGTKD